jgi:Leucine-rich repeat (LRR) protein
MAEHHIAKETLFYIALASALVHICPGRVAAREARRQPRIWDLLRAYQPKAPDAPPTGKGRVVHFPKDRSLGTLKTITDDGGDPTIQNKDFDYQTSGPAIGDVTVPAGRRLYLYVSQKYLKNLPQIVCLGPDDLYGIYISGSYYGGPKAGNSCLRHIGRLTGLKQLTLECTSITASGLQYIKPLKSLNYLHISSDRLGDKDLECLAEFKSVETLVLGGQRVTDEGLKHLEGLTSVREMYLWVNNIRGPGLAHLAKLPRLEYLFLGGDNSEGKCRFRDDAFQYLTKAPSLRNIRIHRHLPLTDAAMPHLARLTQLESLNLYEKPVTDAGLAHIKNLRSLKQLELGATKVTAASLAMMTGMKSLESLLLPFDVSDEHLAGLARLPNLKFLDIQGSFADSGLKHLAALKSLEKLKISSNNVTDQGLAHIGKLTNLRFLSLSTGRITSRGLANLAGLKSLRTLYIYAGDMSVAGVSNLNGLSNLKELVVKHIRQDNSRLDISGLSSMEDLTLKFDRESGLHDEDLACMSKLTRLTRLQLPYKGVSDAGLKYVSGLPYVWMLGIGGEKITDAGLAELAKMRRLTHLSISGDFTDAGLEHLAKLRGLYMLDFFGGANFSEAAVARFKRNMPNLGLMRNYGPARTSRSDSQGSKPRR